MAYLNTRKGLLVSSYMCHNVESMDDGGVSLQHVRHLSATFTRADTTFCTSRQLYSVLSTTIAFFPGCSRPDSLYWSIVAQWSYKSQSNKRLSAFERSSPLLSHQLHGGATIRLAATLPPTMAAISKGLCQVATAIRWTGKSLQDPSIFRLEMDL